MAYKRKRSFKPKYNKKGRKSFKGSRSMRKYRRYRSRPEVKYTPFATSNDQPIKNLVITQKHLNVAHYARLNDYPAQGLTDNLRIGDTIQPLKMWVKIVIQTHLGSIFGCKVRIIIFSMPQDTTTTINDFFQTNTVKAALLGTVNLEIVNKVYYDKVHTLRTNWSNTGLVAKKVNLNIRFRRPVVFHAATVTPKDPKNRLYIAFIGYDPASADGDTIADYQFACNTYFTDS